MVLGFCVACISVVSFCCLSVLRALKQPGPGEGQGDGGNDMKRRAFRIILVSLIVIVGTTILACIPFILMELRWHTELVSYVSVLITNTLARVSGFVHPLLYIHKAGKLPCFN